VEIFNDANSGGFAETWKSEQENMVFYLMLSNSVGGAIIDRDEIYLGDNFRSSEIGHLKIVPDGAPCYCGQKGCVNAYCSAQLLSDRTDGNLEQFFAKVDEGDPECVQALDTYLDYLAVTVINLRMMLDCGIILGGYVGAYMDRCVEKLRERITKLNPYETDSGFVQPCHYKTEASAVGAGLPFIKKFMMEI
jgi:predicted NBD/HSP70 family sugar kinase